jgi:hypothetical protein
MKENKNIYRLFFEGCPIKKWYFSTWTCPINYHREIGHTLKRCKGRPREIISLYNAVLKAVAPSDEENRDQKDVDILSVSEAHEKDCTIVKIKYSK